MAIGDSIRSAKYTIIKLKIDKYLHSVVQLYGGDGSYILFHVGLFCYNLRSNFQPCCHPFLFIRYVCLGWAREKISREWPANLLRQVAAEAATAAAAAAATTRRELFFWRIMRRWPSQARFTRLCIPYALSIINSRWSVSRDARSISTRYISLGLSLSLFASKMAGINVNFFCHILFISIFI